ncbi:hypothetical protein OH775_14050 [Streptomyces sp. NBC_01615]
MLGLDSHAGGVVAGARADLVLHRFERDYACLPVCNPGATLLTCASSRTVDTVLVAGEAVVRDGRSARLSEAFLVDLLSRQRPPSGDRPSHRVGGAERTASGDGPDFGPYRRHADVVVRRGRAVAVTELVPGRNTVPPG